MNGQAIYKPRHHCRRVWCVEILRRESGHPAPSLSYHPSDGMSDSPYRVSDPPGLGHRRSLLASPGSCPEDVPSPASGRPLAWDKRNFIGEDSEVPSCRKPREEGTTLLFSGGELFVSGRSGIAVPPAPILLEAVWWLNQNESPDQPIKVRATARSYCQAKALSEIAARTISPLLLGDPVRLQPIPTVESDAPEQGSVEILVSP